MMTRGKGELGLGGRGQRQGGNRDMCNSINNKNKEKKKKKDIFIEM